MTRLDKQYTLFQQNVLLSTSLHIQKYVDDYFIEKRKLGDSRSDLLFERDVNNSAMSIPPVKVDIRDFATSEQMSYQKLRMKLKAAVLDLAVRITLPDDSDVTAHIFSQMYIPKSKNGYTTKDGKKVDRILGYMLLDIDPKMSKRVFDMGQGYIHHISMIAKYAKNVNTPRVYLYLLRQIGLSKTLDVSVSFLELKAYLGLVMLDSKMEVMVDENGEALLNKYPKFSQFKKQVLDVVCKDLERMEKLFQTDIVFEELKGEDIIYKSGKKKGNPDFIRFHVKRTSVGESHLAKDANIDVAGRINKKNQQSQASKQSSEGDIFAHVYQSTVKNPEVEEGKGKNQWSRFLSVVTDNSQKSLLTRIKFVGMKNNRFCVECSDDDFDDIKKTGLEKVAKKFFGNENSLAPAFYKN